MNRLPEVLGTLGELREHLGRFMASYEFAIQTVETKVKILRQEFELMHSYNPIEHVVTRLKAPQSVIAKARRLGIGPDTEGIRHEIKDIAGVRVVCSFTSDVYRIQEMLCRQPDVALVELKDCIATPKASGYRSLHAIVQVPVFLSENVEHVPVEVQFRTIAQDFWASLEHKIFYKYDKEIPLELRLGLQEAATTAAELDAEMERLSVEIDQITGDDKSRAITEQTARDFLGLFADRHQPPAPKD